MGKVGEICVKAYAIVVQPLTRIFATLSQLKLTKILAKVRMKGDSVNARN